MTTLGIIAALVIVPAAVAGVVGLVRDFRRLRGFGGWW